MAVESTNRSSGLLYDVQVRGFQLQSDVETKLGGTNHAPSPHDLLESALAACTAITVQMYANLKQFPLESVDVKIDIVEEGKVNRIKRKIAFMGNLTPEQLDRLLAIANKCPIHKFLSTGATIETEMVDGAAV